MRIRSHLGTSFKVWHGRHTWFWFVADPCCDGASIGAAANEAEAIGEACSTIEEMAVHRHSRPAVTTFSKTAAPETHECNPASSAAIGWKELLASLDCYLTRLCGEGV
jgi:hypothetical protein